MVDRDEILTKEQEARLEKGLIELKEGKTISLEEFEKELESETKKEYLKKLNRIRIQKGIFVGSLQNLKKSYVIK